MSRPVRVCFFAPLLWPLWSEGRVSFAGGAEVQQAGLARGLAQRGFDVTVVSCDFGQGSPVTRHGVRVLSTYRLTDGPPVLRFFHPRLSHSWRALRAADADVYYVRGASLEAGLAYDAARSVGAAFAFGAAHDLDADPRLPLLTRARDRWWFRRALRGAGAVIAQTSVQQELFRAQHARESTVIRNLVEVPQLAVDPGKETAVVWLATYKAAKRPEWFIELARALPGHTFVMAGVVPIPPATTAAWEAARSAARSLPNLEVLGTLDAGRVSELYRRAALFVHTSPAEGFPNTVLEAWAHGLPSVTGVDPDGVIAREGLGEVADSLPAFIAAVRTWMADPDRRRAAGARARACAQRLHAPEAVLGALGELFSSLAARRVRQGQPGR